MKKKSLNLAVGLAIIVAALFFAFRGVKLSEMVDAFASVHYIYIVPSMVLVVIAHLLRAMRWRILIRSVKDVGTVRLFSPLMVGFMGNMLPARAGEFIRAYLLSRKEGINFTSSFATVFIERLFDLTMVLLLLLSVLLFMPDLLFAGDAAGNYQMAEKVKIFGLLSAVLCAFIFVFAALLQFRNAWAMKLLSFFTRPLPQKWAVKIEASVQSFSQGLSIIRDFRGFILTLFLSLLVWISFILTWYPLYFAFGIESLIPVIPSLVILCLTVSIFITVAPTPGFLGSYHLACVAALHGVFGIAKATALSFAVVAWIVAIGFAVAIGAAFALKEHVSLSDIQPDGMKSAD
jgi:uncharacterized protein (TIRG00374 family)